MLEDNTSEINRTYKMPINLYHILKLRSEIGSYIIYNIFFEYSVTEASVPAVQAIVDYMYSDCVPESLLTSFSVAMEIFQLADAYVFYYIRDETCNQP